MLGNHIQLVASVSTGPWLSPPGSHHEPVNSKSFTQSLQTPPRTAPNLTAWMLLNSGHSRNTILNTVSNKKLKISHLEGKCSQTRPGKLCISLFLFKWTLKSSNAMFAFNCCISFWGTIRIFKACMQGRIIKSRILPYSLPSMKNITLWCVLYSQFLLY